MSDRKSLWPRFLLWIAGTRPGRLAALHLYSPVDRLVYRLTGGKRGLNSKKVTLLLTTTGRRSGQPRSVPVLYLRDGDRFWVMGSNYAKEGHPAWSYNLLANPEALVRIGETEQRVRARLAAAEEKEAMWPRLTAFYPGWNLYRQITDRDFRLFCLEPLD